MAENVGLPPGFVLDGAPQAQGLPDGFLLDAPAPEPEKTYGGTLAAGVKAGAVGGLQTLMELVDPTPMFGMDRVESPIKPDLTKPKAAATQIIDTQRGEYKPGLAGQGLGMITEAASNPLNYILPAKAETTTTGLLANTVGKKMLGGAVIGGEQGFVQGTGTGDSRTLNTGAGALVGAAIPGAAEAVKGGGKLIQGGGNAIKDIKTGLGARAGDVLEQSANALKEQSNSTYKAMRDVGAVLTPDAMQSVASKVETAISGAGKLNSTIHSKTTAALGELRDAASTGSLSLEDLDLYRQLFRDAAKGHDADAQRAVVGINAIDDAVRTIGKGDLQQGSTQAVKLLQQARREWSQKSKFDVVSELVQKSEGDPQKLKTAAKNLLASRKKVRGWTSSEKDGLRQLANRGGAAGALKLMGSFGFDTSSVLRNVVAGGTAYAAGPVGLGVTIASTAARQLEKLLGRGQAENLLQLIEKGAQPQDVAKAVANQAKTPSAAATALKILGGSTSEKGVREQFADLADKAKTEGPTPAPKAPAKPVSLNARPETTALALAGGPAAGVFYGNVEGGRRNYEADQPAQPKPKQPDPIGDLITQEEAAPDKFDVKPTVVAPSFRSKVSRAESSGGKFLFSPTSKAVGEYQFIPKTWLSVVAMEKPKWADGLSKGQILKLRLDGKKSAEMFDALTADNGSRLQKAGVGASDTALYAAHVLGVGDAIDVLKADPATPLSRLVSRDAIERNRKLMKGKTVGAFLKTLSAKMNG